MVDDTLSIHAICFCGYKMIKRNGIGLQIGETANFGVGNSNLTSIIEIDAFLINY